jgi:diguanylate cyclase (GGDEF)-like protein
MPTRMGMVEIAQPESAPARRRWYRRRLDRSAGFGARLALAIVLTLPVVCAIGYLLTANQLRDRQIAEYASDHQADVRNLETVARQDPSASLQGLLDVIGQRAGVLETLLIDQRSIVVGSGVEKDVVGERDSDERIVVALRDGISYAGLEADPDLDGRDFEFVAPVELLSGRHVLEVSYDHTVLDAELGEARRTLGLIGLLALVIGAIVFYLVGGRTLLRSHRIALQRATRDGLTDLPNHRVFQDEFARAVGAAARYEEPLALMLLDVDDFKFLNDRHGHIHGDAILRRVAEVLRNGRAEDRAYRIGGDEFALLLPRTDAAGAAKAAARIVRELSEAEVVMSLGVSDLRRGDPALDLRAEADAALYESKRRGGRRVSHFDEIRDQTVITTTARTDLVRRLIDEEQLTMVFQPIWDLESGHLLGIEALMRPQQEDGLTNPVEAFDLAERIGRVHDLDVLCARRALQEAPELPGDALLFINISPQTLERDAAGATWLLEATASAGIAPHRIVLEVTERFSARTDAVVACLSRLRDDGFRIALDDVGTGNSGLEMLRKVNADFVKIDRSIVLAAPTDRNARAVLMAMAMYARQTGSYVIAEGIEDQRTLSFLGSIAESDVDVTQIIQGGQGFGLGRPTAGPVHSEATELLSHDRGPAPV